MVGESEIVLYNVEKYGNDTLCSSFSSFRKTKRAGAGTSLVSLSVRNLLCVSLGDSAQSNNITLSVSYRVIVLTCGMTVKQNRQ